MAVESFEPRYSRRILGLGGVAAFVLFVLGAPVFVNGIEDDLETRVPNELSDLGFTGLTVEFSGQDGTIACTDTLADPEAAIEAAYNIDGVRSIELERSCRVNTATGTDEQATETTATDGTNTDSTLGSSPTSDVDVSDSTTPGPESSDFQSLASIIETDPQFSLLAVLVVEAGIRESLADPDTAGITMFAPTDEAFENFGADAIALLRSDPDLLIRVLNHHLVADRFSLTDLSDGELATFNGDVVEISHGDAERVMVDQALVIDGDFNSTNGVLHVVDDVLIPADVDLSVPIPTSEVTATLADGAMTIAGTVSSEVDRTALVGPANYILGADNVEDGLVVDRDFGVGGDTLDSMVQVVVVMSANFASGSVRLDTRSLALVGIALTEEGRDEAQRVAGEVGASTEIDVVPAPEPPPEPGPASLETALNSVVTESPILFKPGSSLLDPSSAQVFDGLIILLEDYDGVDVFITVEGHTDSDGVESENRSLSLVRANRVSEELIARGVAESDVTFVGLGSDNPIVVGGIEDKIASRRVAFVVVAA